MCYPSDWWEPHSGSQIHCAAPLWGKMHRLQSHPHLPHPHSQWVSGFRADTGRVPSVSLGLTSSCTGLPGVARVLELDWGLHTIAEEIDCRARWEESEASLRVKPKESALLQLTGRVLSSCLFTCFSINYTTKLVPVCRMWFIPPWPPPPPDRVPLQYLWLNEKFVCLSLPSAVIKRRAPPPPDCNSCKIDSLNMLPSITVRNLILNHNRNHLKSRPINHYLGFILII